MSGLRNIDRRRALKAFRKLGFEIDHDRGKGSHAMIFHPDDPLRKTILSRSDPVKLGTLKGMLDELDLNQEQFLEALGR